MCWNRIRQASLKLRLLALLLPIMVLVIVTSLRLTDADAVASANAAYDRSLLGAIKALDLNISTASGGLSVELPYRLFEFFELTATGNVYFRVATADGMVEIGNPDLPPPPAPLAMGKPMFYDAAYFGETLRVGAFMRPLEQALTASATPQLVIQVAESTTSREQFTASFVRSAAVRDALFVVVMSVAVVLGLSLALRPLTRLARQTRAREADDLRPLQTSDLPSDVRPLVEAVNQQIARTEELVAEQRRFLDDASHQLRTPLTILQTQLDYLSRETDPGKRRAAMDAMADDLGRAIRATNQMLALARSDSATVQREPFDLGDLAREVALELLPLARAREIDFGLEIGADRLPCAGDRGFLRQALVNLAHNAIQHGRAQGIVTLRADADAQGWRLQICDDGAGIDPDLQSRLGQRFARSRASRGSGLGLAIARSVIERHQGQLRIESAPSGQGLWVTLWWPKS